MRILSWHLPQTPCQSSDQLHQILHTDRHPLWSSFFRACPWCDPAYTPPYVPLCKHRQFKSFFFMTNRRSQTRQTSNNMPCHADIAVQGMPQYCTLIFTSAIQKIGLLRSNPILTVVKGIRVGKVVFYRIFRYRDTVFCVSVTNTWYSERNEQIRFWYSIHKTSTEDAA